MTLQDVFDQLSYGELSQIFNGEGDAEGVGILPNQRRRILKHIQLGLTELHKRFLLREHVLGLEIDPLRRSYVIDPKFAQSNERSRVPVRYIDDSVDPISEPIFKIERVYSEKGTEYPLNDNDDTCSVRTGSFNTLLLTDRHKDSRLKVVCRSNHDTIKEYLALDSPELVQIQLPDTHLWALLLFVAHRVLNPVGMVAEFHEGNNYLAKFEAECQRLLDANVVIQQTNEDSRFTNNGWV